MPRHSKHLLHAARVWARPRRRELLFTVFVGSGVLGMNAVLAYLACLRVGHKAGGIASAAAVVVFWSAARWAWSST